MLNLLVLNHGTNTCTTKHDGYVISQLTKRSCFWNDKQGIYCSKPNGILSYPGIGTPEFNSRHGISMVSGVGAILKSGPLMRPTAKWLVEDLAAVFNTKPSDVATVAFIGHSRGCIMMWFQLQALIDAGFTGKVRVLQFDPCYGPKELKESSEISKAQDYGSLISTQVLMLNEESSLGILPAYPPRDPAKSWFLPGVHGSAVNNGADSYPGMGKIGEDIMRQFLLAIGNNNSLFTKSITAMERCRVYAQCKRQHPAANFAKCERKTADGQYQTHKQLGCRTWALRKKNCFFYGLDDFEAFRITWPDLADAIRGSALFNKTRARDQLKGLENDSVDMAWAVNDWCKRADVSLL